MKIVKTIINECKEAIIIMYSCFFEICIVTPYLICKEYITNYFKIHKTGEEK